MTREASVKYGDRLIHNGHWHVVVNIDCFGIWLISLEHKDALPYLALPRLPAVTRVAHGRAVR